MQIERFDPVRVPAPAGGYTHGLAVSGAERLLFVSGQTPEGPEGLPDGFEAQCEQTWANLLAVLAEAGASVAQIVKVTTYLSDRAHATANSAIRQRVLGDHRPALTVVLAGIYDPAWLLEIEAIAALPDR